MKKLIFLILFLMTGCWNYQELNDLAITTALAIDKKDDKYEVSILIANSKKNEASAGENKSQTIVYSGIGNNIAEALKEIDLLSPKQIYIEHLSIIVISKEVASEGLINVIDYFLRNSESTKRFQIVLADNAKDIIKIINPLETFPASSISKNIKLSNESQAQSSSIVYSEFLYKLLEKGINPAIPTVSIKGNPEKGSKNKSLEQTTPEATVKLSNIALIKEDKYITTVDENESKGINIINNKIDQMNLYLKCNKNYITIKILSLTSKLSIVNPRKKEFKISIVAEGNIIEDTCKNDLSKKETISKLEKKSIKNLKSIIQKGIDVAKNNNTDVFGFGNLLYKNYPKLYPNNWDEEFKNANIDIDIDLKIRFKGAAKQNIKEVLSEN